MTQCSFWNVIALVMVCTRIYHFDTNMRDRSVLYSEGFQVVAVLQNCRASSSCGLPEVIEGPKSIGMLTLELWDLISGENARFRHCPNKGKLCQMKNLNKCKISENIYLLINPFLALVWSSPFVKLQYSCVLEIYKIWAPNSFCKWVIEKIGFRVDIPSFTIQ